MGIHIKENRFSGDMIEYGVVEALFEEFPASEVNVCSGSQQAFDAAKQFVKSMIENQCELAGCTLQHQPYGVGDVHTEKCWFTKRWKFYQERRHGLEETT
jgi:hypothetical protein